jgi:hypothetical protein
VAISKSSGLIKEKNEKGKEAMKVIELNEIAFMEPVLSIDVSISSGKIAFGMVKDCKTKDFEDGNGALAWVRFEENVTLFLPRHW